MIGGARQLPVHHLTIRVPWHDNSWQGTFCHNPCSNTCCTILPRIATGRDDRLETEHAGESLKQASGMAGQVRAIAQFLLRKNIKV